LRFVSPALKHVVFPLLSKSGYLRHAAGAGPAIVTYHGVFPAGYKVRNSALDGNLVHADSFRRQLRLLKKHYQVISPERFLQWSQGELVLPSRSILLTCDDALRSTLTEMVPILRELDLSCLFFATGASADKMPSSPMLWPMLWYEELYLMLLEASDPIVLGLPEAGISLGPIASNAKHSAWWNLVERLSQFNGQSRPGFLDQIRAQLGLAGDWRSRFVQDLSLAARFLILDRDGLQQLTAAGMTIGAHSLSHPILARTSEELAWQEISESRSVLENALGQMVWAFAYPFGNAATVTWRDLKFAEQAGFRCAFMNVGGGFGSKMIGAKIVDTKIVDTKINRFALPRVHVTADMSLSEFEAHISGFYRSLRQRLLSGDVDELGAVEGS
jgi:peptidoglycan/xylan/chitin deacetylase (PgdA/CDA1 family)